MRRQPLDPVIADEIRHDRDMEHAQELVAAQIDEMMDTVWSEVAEGEHDNELSQSSWLDLTLAMKVARTVATAISDVDFERKSLPLHPLDTSDLYLQITDYVRDIAEMRLTR